MLTFAWFESLWQDLYYAARGLRKNPGFAAVVMFSLALGIGANSTIFSVFNAVMLRPLPFEQPEDRCPVLGVAIPRIMTLALFRCDIAESWRRGGEQQTRGRDSPKSFASATRSRE
jgi:hypothetical protein